MEFLHNYFNLDNNITVFGLTKELNIQYIKEKFNAENDNVIVLVNTLYEANKLYEGLKTYVDEVFLFPMDDFLASKILATSPEFKIKRLETLEKINQNKKSIVITNLMGYLHYLPSKNLREKLKISLKKGMEINRDKLHKILIEFGYNKESIVTITGEYAIRGFVVDIFLIHEEYPLRIEFFGDEIESIKYFDEKTQLTIKEIDEITFSPFTEIETEESSSIFDYLNNPTVIYVDYNQIKASYIKLQEDILNYQTGENITEKLIYDLDDINPNKIVYIDTFGTDIKEKKFVNFKNEEVSNFNSDFEKLKLFVFKELKHGKTIIFYLSKDKQIDKIKELFDDVNLKGIVNNKINVIKEKINQGFILDKYVVISEYDIENIKKTAIKYKNSYKIGKKVKEFNDIKTGDFVVHIAHGIGIYSGVITLTKNKVKKDYLQINYSGNDKIYIPVEKIDTIYKYSAKEGSKPKLNKLGTSTWSKTKAQLRNKIKDISEMLIKLYAQRTNNKSVSFNDYLEEDLFALDFPYVLTEDQVKAVRDINNDLKSSIPMERLLCGDVGFGKTEVAFRAIFKTVVNNYQVMYLCPTTILSKQQYESAKERFRSFPVNVALLNRFVSQKQVTKIISDFNAGKIDILIGTHKLLNKEIKPKNLGLLVIDEEQRFGVTHKEKIKSLKSNINVLTLSATPIPRTLKMSMSGLRDLSIIDTPPEERYPVQTYVILENDLLVKDAIYKELAREGQIFILYNKVESIDNQLYKIQKLVPEARIEIAHGQMSKTELEDVMQKFINYEADILLCTTIIETGIDISNVNTLIIYDADNFGLSQLYQIRGRVGRSNKIGYAYLMYKGNKLLNEVAIKRLNAIKEFTELGSGYKIAMRDLAIRGAGDFLGSEQAGFVSDVGIELYMKMIEEEIKRQNGETVEEDIEEAKSLIDIETHISDSYVTEESIKIEIHQKINEIDSENKFFEIKQELEDRFGKLPESLIIYMYEERFEKLAKKLNITQVKQDEKLIEIILPEEISNVIKGDKLFLQAYNINPKFQFKYLRNRIYISLALNNLDKHFIYYLIALLIVIDEQIK